MTMSELSTVAAEGLPIKIAIINNGYLGMVRQWQELFYDRRYACTLMDHQPDFVKLAEAYGALGLRATRPDEVEKVLQEGLEELGRVLGGAEDSSVSAVERARSVLSREVCRKNRNIALAIP